MTTSKQELAKEFTSLILPRLMETYTRELEERIESLEGCLEAATTKTNTPVDLDPLNKQGLDEVKDLLEKNKDRWKKVLSGEKRREMEEFFEDKFGSSLMTVAMLKQAIEQERLTLVINSIAEESANIFYS